MNRVYAFDVHCTNLDTIISSVSESDVMGDVAIPGLLDIPEEATGHDKGKFRVYLGNRGNLGYLFLLPPLP